MKDYFISYNGEDRPWAVWIAWTLEENDYTILIQEWDFRPGENFAVEMQNAITECERTIAVLSANYLKSVFTRPEWAAVFAADPLGAKRKFIPIRVAQCEPTGLLATIIYADLVGLTESDARETLLAALRVRGKPEMPPAFPGPHAPGSSKLATARSMPDKQPFPGSPSTSVLVWKEKLEFLERHETIVSNPDQKSSLTRQIVQAKAKVREFGG